MRLFFIIFFLLAKFSEACHAQTSAIHIFVFKEDNPLQDATVKFNKKHFKTNLSGEVLVPINHKSDSITISYLGLQTQKILLNASIQDTLFVHMLSDNILIDEVKVLPPNYAKKLLAIAYKKHTQFNNWESYILQYMGEDFDYVKVTEASAHIYTPEIYKDEKKNKHNNIRLALTQVIERIENKKMNGQYHFDFRTLLYKGFTTDLVINTLEKKKSSLKVKENDIFWLIETPDTLSFKNSFYNFNWIISKKDTILIQVKVLVISDKVNSTYTYDFNSSNEGTYLYKAIHHQSLIKGEKNYSGALEIYLYPTLHNFSSISSIDDNLYDFSKTNKIINTNPEDIEGIKLKLNVPVLKFNQKE